MNKETLIACEDNKLEITILALGCVIAFFLAIAVLVAIVKAALSNDVLDDER